MDLPRIREGQAPPRLPREEFARRFRERFADPAFDVEHEALARLEQIAWEAYQEGRKAPRRRLAGPGFADPSYELSVEWLENRERILEAQRQQATPGGPARVLLIVGSARNDGSCPSEASKSWRLANLAQETLEGEKGCEVDRLDLSLLTSEYGRQIHPCKGCLSTAMPLCHWPCSCYPNASLGQVNDAMANIYVQWARAHAVMIVTPVYWYQTPGGLKSMIDRLVCADGGNPDPTRTQGKKPELAKEIELSGWSYPQHLAGRAYGVVVHGDVAGIEGVRRALCDWLEWMGLIDASAVAKLDRYIGYYEPYATSHDTLDRDQAMQDETRNVARALAEATAMQRSGEARQPDRGLVRPRPK